MAIEQQANEHLQNHPFLLDALYCEEEEEKWGELEEEEEEEEEEEGLDEETDSQNNCTKYNNKSKSSSLFPLLLLEQDLFWEDEELISLFTKEKQTHCSSDNIESNPALSEARRDAVSWILKVNVHYGFSALTAILAINYLDRFLSSLQYQEDKPWMIQLAAVTCLSLAAKVEETDVPLLLNFQIEDASYVFEAKTIQKMELLVLSTLKWRMNPVTPLSFLDHIIRRLGLKNYLHWEFLRRCETLVLSILADSRFVRYLPSILATATMLHVIHQVEPCNAIDYQNQLLDVLKISKDKVNACYDLISDFSNATTSHAQSNINTHKRKYNHQAESSSSRRVIDSLFCSDSSDDSWGVELSSVSSSPDEPLFKKSRVHEQQMRLPSVSCRVFVDAVASPR